MNELKSHKTFTVFGVTGTWQTWVISAVGSIVIIGLGVFAVYG